jgi:CO/xanthine dehydrogenase Mo-binding subunit
MTGAIHVDGRDKVTGRERYVADLRLPGCLIGKALRSPLPHARIKRIDVARACQVPGVRAVLSGQDSANRLIGRILHDMPLLARDRVRFVGEKVAAVAAENHAAADEALSLIDVEYEELPSVFDPEHAIQPGAPRLHPDVRSYRGRPADLPDIPNLQSRLVSHKGDVERGFAESEHVFDFTFSVPTVHQGYLEPHACVVNARSERIEVWASNKSPFKLRELVASLAEVEPDQVLVHVGALGGDFGGKGSFMDVPLCYALSAISGAPVRMVMSYTDELMAGNPRHAAMMRVRTGVRSDGCFWARDYQVIYNGGAYGAFKPVGHVNLNGALQGGGPYRIPHVRMEGLCVYTNTTPRGHFRAPGEAQTLFAVESATDMIATQLGMDPYELRRLNAMVPGDVDARGRVLEDVRLREVLDAAIAASGWGQPKAQSHVGRGISLFNRALAEGTSSAKVGLAREGLTLTTALADVGTGLHTTLRAVVARTMGVPAHMVQVAVGDTDAVLPDQGVGATRVTVLAGEAAQLATQEVKATFLNRLSQVYGWAAERIEIRDGVIHAPDGSQLDFAAAVHGTVEADEERIEASVQRSVDHSRHPTVATAQVAEVHVDPETGEITVLSFVSAHDVGEILNPVLHQGQINGGVVQGLGYALMEELPAQDGRVETLSLGDYKLPTEQDVPPLKTVLVTGGHGPGPFGSKAIGESALGGVAPAIANAIFDAVGARVTSLPLNSEKVRAAGMAMPA